MATQGASRTQTSGVLPVTASQTSGNGSKPLAAPKAPTQKLKVIVRRLPPGLTEVEFISILGDEWKLGQGKVDWFLYKPGKNSKDLSKPSRPARAYLHLTSEPHLLELSDVVRQSIFEDAQNTSTSSCLMGPPSVEFAPYGRVPHGRHRVDARAGTIDQDPEFMAFLEGLANPVTTKEVSTDGVSEGTAAKPEKVTTTPLVQYLKDKKANKSKEAAAKAAKKQEIAKSKAAKDTSPEDVKKKSKDGKPEKATDKAAKEAVKILNREAASKSAPTGSENTAPPKLNLEKVPTRQRGTVVAAHIRMLQRDLGLSPAQAHRQVRRDTADAQKAERAAAVKEATSAVVEDRGSSSKTSSTANIATTPRAVLQSGSRKARAKGVHTEQDTPLKSPAPPVIPSPMVLLKKPQTSQSGPSTPTTPSTQVPKSTPAVLARKPAPIAVPADGAKQAFVKHANPSQGVTEALLKEAMERFGPVSMVEIDKRKGFAYVDFVNPEGLKKAMAANPISVAQGTVQVMQRKGTAPAPEKNPKLSHQTPQTPPARGGRGGRGGTVGRRGGRGGGGGRGGANAGPSETSKIPASTPAGPSVK